MKQIDLNGTGVALVTPFLNDGSIDFDSLGRLIEYNLENGIDYLVVMGSTGEAATLSAEEKEKIRAFFVRKTAGRLPLVLGMGSNNTAALVEEVRRTDLSGFDALLSVSPSYNKPSQEGIYRHYAALAEVTPIPVIIYNVPGRTGSNISPETALRLARDFDKIAGIKEAAGSMEQVLRLTKDKPDGFHIISGDDMLALPTVLAGGSGVISVIAQAFPRIFSSMIEAGRQGKVKEAFDLHYSVMNMIDLIFAEGNPTGIKQLLALQGLTKAFVRLPLTSASKHLAEAIRIELQKISS